MKEDKQAVCGHCKELHYDKKIENLNLELVRVKNEGGVYYEIVFQDWTNEKKTKDLLRLHIKEALELKSIIDTLVYDSVETEREWED